MVLRAMVIMPMDSNNPADAAVNTFHFSSDDPISGNLAPITAALKAFYDSVGSALSVSCNPAGATVKFYDLEQPEPRPPIDERSLALGGATGTGSFPPELAICMSFEGARQAGMLQARRRGRIYLGPLATAAASGPNIATGIRTSIALAGENLLTASLAAAGWAWGVYSRVETVGDGFTPVTNGWVDDAFDVQRRRGLAPLSRTLFP